MNKNLSTEQQISNAARKVFLQKGYAGARMQEIADEAGINKALLHYYFRSKEKLFDSIMLESIQAFFPKAFKILSSDELFENRVKQFVEQYLEMLKQNPLLPLFIIQELNRDPEKLIEKVFEKVNLLHQIQPIIQKEIDKGLLINVDPVHILINILSSCIFPFLARPLLSQVLLDKEDEFDKFIERQKEILPDIIFNGILAENQP